MLRTHARGTCGAATLPSVVDVEASGAAELVGLAGLRHGSERRAAQVEVHGLGQARAGGALVCEDHRHRAAGARRVTGAFHLQNLIITPTAPVSLLSRKCHNITS